MSKPELRRRYVNGLDALMWGTDYPHPEGTWPNTARAPRPPTSAAIPVEETRLLLGLNAVRCYDLDLDAPRPRSPPTSGRRPSSSTRTSTCARRPTRSARPASGSTTTASSGRADEPSDATDDAPPLELDGAVAVVTGGAGGIGRGIVGALLRRGATVVIADVEQAAIDAAVADLAPLGPVSGHRTDITDEHVGRRARRRTSTTTHGRVQPALQQRRASPRAAAASRGSRSRTTGAGASASTCSARRSAPRRSCPA